MRDLAIELPLGRVPLLLYYDCYTGGITCAEIGAE